MHPVHPKKFIIFVNSTAMALNYEENSTILRHYFSILRHYFFKRGRYFSKQRLHFPGFRSHFWVLEVLDPSYDQMEYFCLPIAEIDYYALSSTPPLLQHFDLISGEVSGG